MPFMTALRRRVLDEALEEDIRRERRYNRRRARLMLRRTVDPFTAISEKEFVKTFRLYKDDVMGDLASVLIPLLPVERRRDTIITPQSPR